MIARGAIVWVDLGAALGSSPAKRRPVLVIQNDAYNRSGLATAIVVSLTTNTSLAEQPGNVFVPATASALPRDSVANVTQVSTIDKDFLSEPIGMLPSYLMAEVDRGIRLVLDL